MEQLLELLEELPEYRELRTAVAAGESPVTVYGLLPVHSAHYTAGLAAKTGRPVLAICRDEGAAESFARDLSAFSGRETGVLPGRDLVFHDIETASRQGEQKRLRLLYEFGRGELTALVTTAEALQLQTMPPELLRRSALVLEQDGEIPPEQAVDGLLNWATPGAMPWRARASSPCGAASWMCLPPERKARSGPSSGATPSILWGFLIP